MCTTSSAATITSARPEWCTWPTITSPRARSNGLGETTIRLRLGPNLTDEDGPYIELMAGVYTDNQPDFSFLQPGETKIWSQYWYPIQQIGPAQHANRDAAVSVELAKDRFRIGVSVTGPLPGAVVRLESPNGDTEWEADWRRASRFVWKSLPPGASALGPEAGLTDVPRVFWMRRGGK